MRLGMTWIDLGNPVPRSTPRAYSPVQWQESGIAFLAAPPTDIVLPALNTILDRRKTTRHFGPLLEHELSYWLWFIGRETGRGHSEFGFPLTTRPVPSAGAIHPIHILISDLEKNCWHRYIPDQHALASLSTFGPCISELHQRINQLVEVQNGVVIWLLAEPEKTGAKYANPCSLIWRDAGVLLGQMALVAEGLEINFCPLGITGQDHMSALDRQQRLTGVSFAILGSRR